MSVNTGHTIPEGWTVQPLRDLILKFLNGGTPDTSNPAYWDGPIPWITGADAENAVTTRSRDNITELGVKESSTNVVPKGNILLVTRTGVGKVSIAGVDVAISQDLTGLIPNPDIVDVKYLHRQLLFLGPYLQRFAQGTIIQGIERGEVERIPIPLPLKPEQSRIAAVLDLIDAAIARTEAVIAKLKQVRAGLLHDLLTRGLDENGELRDPIAHSEQFKDSPLGRIPREWDQNRLSELVRQDSPITYGVVQPGPEDENGVMFVRGGDFPNGQIIIEQLRTITKAVSDSYKRTVLEGGEVLVSLVGQPGSCAVVPHELIGANIARQTAMIRLRSGEIKPQFLRHYLSSAAGQKALLGETIGSVQRVVNLDRLRTVLVPRPSPPEQDAIAVLLLKYEHLLGAEEAESRKLAQTKSGLMSDLLTGRVSLPASLMAGVPAMAGFSDNNEGHP